MAQGWGKLKYRQLILSRYYQMSGKNPVPGNLGTFQANEIKWRDSTYLLCPLSGFSALPPSLPFFLGFHLHSLSPLSPTLTSWVSGWVRREHTLISLLSVISKVPAHSKLGAFPMLKELGELFKANLSLYKIWVESREFFFMPPPLYLLLLKPLPLPLLLTSTCVVPQELLLCTTCFCECIMAWVHYHTVPRSMSVTLKVCLAVPGLSFFTSAYVYHQTPHPIIF